MAEDKNTIDFLSKYNKQTFENALALRKVLFGNLPGIIEQVDFPAKMIAYCYGQKYIEMICTLIPSKKGIKLGFYKGGDLADPEHLLKGSGKISKYVEIKSGEEINAVALKQLITNALMAYKYRISNKQIKN